VSTPKAVHLGAKPFEDLKTKCMTQPLIPEIAQKPDGTTQDYAYFRLRNAIMVGALKPGTALTFRGLAQQLGLSPTPIREAVRRLSTEYAIEVLGNRRLRVPEMTIGRFEELVALRIVLETHAAERAFPYLSDVHIERLDSIDDKMDGAIKAHDLDGLTRLNHKFHLLLYGLNPNQSVTPLIESIWLQLGPFQRQVIENLEASYVVDRHKEMLKAMRDRDIAALCDAIESDIRDGSISLGRQVLRGSTQSQSGHAY
jgi:DNA-binding GntR family transcriptional regulator